MWHAHLPALQPAPCCLQKENPLQLAGLPWVVDLTDPSGRPAIPHGSRVKIRLQHSGGWWVDRLPAWIKWATGGCCAVLCCALLLRASSPTGPASRQAALLTLLSPLLVMGPPQPYLPTHTHSPCAPLSGAQQDGC